MTVDLAVAYLVVASRPNFFILFTPCRTVIVLYCSVLLVKVFTAEFYIRDILTLSYPSFI